jgi:hypothetical protein
MRDVVIQAPVSRNGDALSRNKAVVLDPRITKKNVGRDRIRGYSPYAVIPIEKEQLPPS